MVKPTIEERKWFDYCLKIGEGGEFLLKLLSAQNGTLVEVKTDLKTVNTGNLFIEYEDHGGVPTCLSVTKSLWWAHIVQDDQRPLAVYWFRVAYMRYHLPKMKLKIGKGGDSGNSTGYLLPVCKTQKLTLPIPT